jgi:hypothetical protein
MEISMRIFFQDNDIRRDAGEGYRMPDTGYSLSLILTPSSPRERVSPEVIKKS